ncbi:hypothetical protein BIFDEN_00521 [Bifidobacterium dentium ATCC 27678]|nr:hypothetical protein BIFDEN_00521 [Bifidobacterium dentium ATCC 27678]
MRTFGHTPIRTSPKALLGQGQNPPTRQGRKQTDYRLLWLLGIQSSSRTEVKNNFQ